MRRLPIALTMFLLACSTPPSSNGAGASSSGSAAVSTAAPSQTAAGTPSQTASVASIAPPVGPAPDGPTHYVSSTPPAANAACKPLPKGPQSVVDLARAVRRLSCEPALYFLTAEKLHTELALPADHTVSFVGPSSVSIAFPPARAADLAAGMGVKGAVAARSNKGPWGFRIWNMVTDPVAGKLDHYEPGIAIIGVKVDTTKIDDKVESTPLGDSKLDGSLIVTMPSTVLALKDDEIAVSMLVDALARIASNKASLGKEPEKVAKEHGLHDDRFRVSRRSIGTGAGAVNGIDVWTARTRIAAGPVIEGLGLSGKIEPKRATDTDDYVLYSGQSDEHAWRGLKIELVFEEREGDPASGPYGGYVLEGVLLMP